jgi:hypothetical protein
MHGAELLSVVVWEFASGSFRKSSSVSTRQQTRALVECEADLCGGICGGILRADGATIKCLLNTRLR